MKNERQPLNQKYMSKLLTGSVRFKVWSLPLGNNKHSLIHLVGLLITLRTWETLCKLAICLKCTFWTNLIWVFMHIVPLYCVFVFLLLSFSATWTKIAGLTVQYAVHLLSHNSPLSFKPSPVKYWALSGVNAFCPALRHKWGLCTIVYSHRPRLGSAQWCQSKPESLSDIQEACH